MSWALPAASQPRLVQPVVELVSGSSARTVFDLGGRATGSVHYGRVGAQGKAPAVGKLTPVDLGAVAPAAATTVTARTYDGTGRIDNLLVMPEVASLVASGNGHATAVLSSKSRTVEVRRVAIAGTGKATVSSYDRNGRRLVSFKSWGASPLVLVLPGGFTVVTR